MFKRLFLVLTLAWMLSACSISISSNGPTPTSSLFATSTLPATSTPFPHPDTPTPTSVTPTAGPPSAACSERAVVVQDVTIPDNTYIAPGATFTKTWRLENTGTCAWKAYTIAFASGDQMGAPDSVPVPDTAPKATVDVSVPLTAPTAFNAYAGYFVLNDRNGKPVPIGIYKSFWVKVIVGDVQVTPASLTGTPVATVAVIQPTSPIGCKYTFSNSYVSQIESLINSARTQAGLNQLSINSQLTAAAQGHSQDMACHSLLSHTGSDGSSIYQRIVAAGYNPVNYLEIIFASGYPQDAFNWWMNDKIHHDAILNPSVTEMGSGYAYVSSSAYGGYYTVDFGSQ